ncbi:MAG TPA: hypothetical protein PL110_12470 [Candidatus Eremiobacteraeota bacterium]|nr:MAG: hypothetical protein BWY64_03948 [bacterium ADurb.Bin363]HPZ08925.1 hypothetical protein [Candidatus Eremiobacteraeota bacterium]
MKIVILLIIFFLNLFQSCIAKEQKIPIMLAIDEKLPSSIEARACKELTNFLKQNGFELILFPEERKTEMSNLICQFLDNDDQNLFRIAKEKGALFLICGKLQALETGTTTVYNTTLNEIEIFGEIKLFYVNKKELPLNMKIKEKGLSVQLQESYQQALGKALESFQKTIIMEIR